MLKLEIIIKLVTLGEIIVKLCTMKLENMADYSPHVFGNNNGNYTSPPGLERAQ